MNFCAEFLKREVKTETKIAEKLRVKSLGLEKVAAEFEQVCGMKNLLKIGEIKL